MHHIASKQDGLSVPIRAPLPENMPRGAMRASPQERFTRAPASRAHPRPAGESHARAALSTPTCAMFSDSKMRPRIGLRQAEHRVSRQSTSGNGHSAQAWACNGRGNLHTHCRSRRRGRSSEPGREAGTHPWDGHGSTLSSALRHGHGERQRDRGSEIVAARQCGSEIMAARSWQRDRESEIVAARRWQQ